MQQSSILQTELNKTNHNVPNIEPNIGYDKNGSDKQDLASLKMNGSNNSDNMMTKRQPKNFSEIPRTRPSTPLLDTINSPDDLTLLSTKQLLTLADELREYLLYSAGVSGGHFGANLGTVELTIALHHLLNTPKDQLVWDVGHQAYAHKVLTGRREQLPTIRSKDGLTAFPERSESEYDSFGVGHSSTAISAGLGMSVAMRYQHIDATVACVIGDGAMTGGMAFEAMNDAVQQNADLLVVLNDNDMSISCATGGFTRHLTALWQAGYQIDIDEHGQAKIAIRPDMLGFNSRSRQPFFNDGQDVPISADNIFRAIGFSYFGPFDGHDLPELVRVLGRAKNVKGPVLVHVYTTKGKGFTPAEDDPVKYHAIGKLPSPEQAKTNADDAVKAIPKYSEVFGQFICDKAKVDNKLLAITPAMEEGSGMTEFARQYPDRFFDVAIAEQHAVTLAAGMATQGVKPIVAIYSTFLQRGYDQLVHDVALQNLDVTFAIDRAGLVGEDGATHAGVFDYAYMRCLPNVVIAAPKDENECYHLLNTCYEYPGTAAVRYPRGKGMGVEISQPAKTYAVGKAKVESSYNNAKVDKKVAILAFGTLVKIADVVAQKLADAQNVAITVVNMRWVKPLDTAMITQLMNEGVTHFVTLEEHAVMGGAGSAVNEYLVSIQADVTLLNLGIPDRFIAHASHSEQLADCELDVAGVLKRLTHFLI